MPLSVSILLHISNLPVITLKNDILLFNQFIVKLNVVEHPQNSLVPVTIYVKTATNSQYLTSFSFFTQSLIVPTSILASE